MDDQHHMQKIILLLVNIFSIVNLLLQSVDTPYDKINNDMVDALFPKEYRIRYFRYLARHGSRYPSRKVQSSIIQTLELFSPHSRKLKRIFDANRELLRGEKVLELSKRGREEHYNAGKRFRTRFAELFDSDPTYYQRLKFESTCASRSYNSMQEFIKGLLSRDSGVEITNVTRRDCENDHLYKFDSWCPRYKGFHDCHKLANEEEEKLYTKKEFQDLTVIANQKLGLTGYIKLTPDDTANLYRLCAFNEIQSTQNDQRSEVCDLFDETSLNAFEYITDMKYFYKYTPSIRINTLMACELYTDIIKKVQDGLEQCTILENVIDSDQKLGDFGFAHAETLLPILGYFNIFSDNPHDTRLPEGEELNARNFKKLRYHRKFQGSHLSPMAANLLFAVGCHKQGNNQGIVMILHNEWPIRLPCCKSHVTVDGHTYPVCTHKEFKMCYTKRLKRCDFNVICKKPNNCERATPRSHLKIY